MGEGIAHIISPLTAPWYGWTLLLLFLFAILSEWLQPGVITKAKETLRAHNDRMYKDAPTNALAQVLITFYRIGVLALALCLSFGSYDNFSFLAFLIIIGLILGVLVTKMLCNVWLDYTFMLSRRFGVAYEHYSNILTMVCVWSYPFLLLFMHFGNQTIARWLLGIFAVVFLILWIYRSARLYVQSVLSLIYLLVYIVTLELLPMAVLVLLSAKTISIL